MHILQKALLAICCWLAGTGLGLVFLLAGAGWPDGGSSRPLLPMSLLGVYMAVYGFPVWLLTFVPPFYAVKERGIFWRPYIAAPFGACMGYLGFILLLQGSFSNLTRGLIDERFIAWTPIVIGGLTFFFGTIVKQRYLQRLFVRAAAMLPPEKTPDQY